MPVHLIHQNAEAVIKQLKRLNKRAKYIAGSDEDGGPLQDISKVLREIRDVIKGPGPGGGGGGDTSCDDETQEFLDEALKGSRSLNKIFAAAELNSLEVIAGDPEQKAKARAKEIRNMLRPHAEEFHVDLPPEGQLTKAVKCAREKVYGRQDSPNNTVQAAS